jgi:predicted component of type VI protein secretion system
MAELSKEKSEEFAAQFELLKFCVHQLDWEYAELLVRGLRSQASRQESLSFLNPAYPQTKNDLIRLQAEALEKFTQGVRLLRECDQLKKKIEADSGAREKILEIFL